MWSIIFMVINFKIVKSTLQNALFLHFFSKKFAYVKKKQYLCTRFRNSSNHNNLKKITIMKTIKTLNDLIAKDAQVIIEIHNRLNILGISYYNKCYVVTWYNRIMNNDHHYLFESLNKAQEQFNLIQNLQF